MTSGKYTFVPNGVNYNPTTNTYTPHTKAISFQDWAQNYPYRAMVTESESKEYANVFDRSFIKLRSVVLEYDFTSILNPKGFVKGLTVNLSGYNLAMWKKSKTFIQIRIIKLEELVLVRAEIQILLMIFRILPADGLVLGLT